MISSLISRCLRGFSRPRTEGPAANSLEGICTVCGVRAVFEGFTENERESGFCTSCGCSNRQRQMAYAIRKRFRISKRGPLRFGDGFRIYNTEANGSVHWALSVNPGYICSEYFGDQYSGGELVGGVRHESLLRLSLADLSFDLVLSSDVLEHLPEPYSAHEEILRVLKPGGAHIFTVPFNPGILEDDIRCRIVDGKIEYLAEKLYHCDPVRPEDGILVWTIFGQGMLAKLREIGFQAHMLKLNEPRHGIIGNGAIVFEAIKPEC